MRGKSRNSRARLMKDLHGFVYRLKKVYQFNPNRKYWRCTMYRRNKKGCNAKATTFRDLIITKTCMHNHPL